MAPILNYNEVVKVHGGGVKVLKGSLKRGQHASEINAPRYPTHIWSRGLPNNMISSFLRSTRNLSSVHSGSRGCGPLRSSSDPGRGESALRSLLEPWSDCGKYPDKGSHWAAMTLRYSFSRGRLSAEITEQLAADTRSNSSGEVSRVIRQKKARLLPETRANLPFGSCKMVPNSAEVCAK